MNWRRMDTDPVPRDGTPVLLGVAGCDARYVHKAHFDPHDEVWVNANGKRAKKAPDWALAFTHWTPVTAPPAQEAS